MFEIIAATSVNAPVFVVLTTGPGANPVAVLNTYAAAAEVAASRAFEASVADLA